MRKDRREEAIQEYARWFGEFRWGWFGTAKLVSGFPSDAVAKKCWDQWISAIQRVYGGKKFRWVRVLERGGGGNNRHFHFLVGGFRNRRKAAEALWRSLGADPLIAPFDREQKGILYLLKSMDEAGNLDLDFKLPRKGVQSTRGRSK